MGRGWQGESVEQESRWGHKRGVVLLQSTPWSHDQRAIIHGSRSNYLLLNLQIGFACVLVFFSSLRRIFGQGRGKNTLRENENLTV